MANLRTWHTGCSTKHRTDGESNFDRSNAEMKVCEGQGANLVCQFGKTHGDILPKECCYSCRDIRDFEQRLRDPRRATDLAIIGR